MKRGTPHGISGIEEVQGPGSSLSVEIQKLKILELDTISIQSKSLDEYELNEKNKKNNKKNGKNKNNVDNNNDVIDRNNDNSMVPFNNNQNNNNNNNNSNDNKDTDNNFQPVLFPNIVIDDFIGGTKPKTPIFYHKKERVKSPVTGPF